MKRSSKSARSNNKIKNVQLKKLLFRLILSIAGYFLSYTEGDENRFCFWLGLAFIIVLTFEDYIFLDK